NPARVIDWSEPVKPPIAITALPVASSIDAPSPAEVVAATHSYEDAFCFRSEVSALPTLPPPPPKRAPPAAGVGPPAGGLPVGRTLPADAGAEPMGPPPKPARPPAEAGPAATIEPLSALEAVARSKATGPPSPARRAAAASAAAAGRVS